MANLLEEANDLSGTGWFPNANAVVTANYANDPDAAMVACRLQASSAGGTGNVQSSNTITLASSSPYSAHGFFKADQTDVVRIQIGAVSSLDISVTANLTSGTITGTGTNTSSSGITAYADDWYWVWMTFTSDAVDNTGSFIVRAGSSTVTLDGTTSILSVGVWLEEGSIPTPAYSEDEPLTSHYLVRALFDVDYFSYGTTYYFNPDRSGTSNGTGVSDANAFYTVGQINNKVFAQGDKLLFRAGTTYTATSLFRNTTLQGNGSDEPFYIGAYHMVEGVETPGLGGEARPNFDGMDYDEFDAFGGMSQATCLAMAPPPPSIDNLGVEVEDGAQAGLWHLQGFTLHLRIGDIALRASGGKGLALANGTYKQTGGLLVQNMYIEGTMKQAIHLAGVYDAIVEDCFCTLSDLETIYGGDPGNHQAHVGTKGTQGSGFDIDQRNFWFRNCLWDSVSGDGFITNSGARNVHFVDNVLIDSGGTSALYWDRTYDSCWLYNIFIRTSRNPFHAWSGATTDGRGGVGFRIQNEKATGSFPWDEYNTEADFLEYQAQRGIAGFNIVIGAKDNFALLSQASTADESQPLQLGVPHSAGVYILHNMSLDPADTHFNIDSAAPTSRYALREDIPPRVEGNIFWNGTTQSGDNTLATRNDAEFATLFKNNYRSSDIPELSELNLNEVTTGLEMPLDDYWDLSSYMTTDANGWMNYTNVRAFLTTIGIDPDDLSSKSLTLFKPTTPVSSGLPSSGITLPEGCTWPDDITDIEGNALPTTLYMGPFQTLADSTVTVTMTTPDLTLTPSDMELTVSGNVTITMTTPDLTLTPANMTLQLNTLVTMTTPFLSLEGLTFDVVEEQVAPPQFVRMVFTMDMPTMTFREL